MKFHDLKGQFGYPLAEEFDPKQFETSIGPFRAYSLANSICEEALKDANLDTHNMIYDKDRFGLNLPNLFGGEEDTEHAYTKGKNKEKLALFNFNIPAVIAMKL